MVSLSNHERVKADFGKALGANAHPACHREERSPLMVSLSNHVAISLPEETPLPSRDCHAPLAMTVRLQLGSHESARRSPPATHGGHRPSVYRGLRVNNNHK